MSGRLPGERNGHSLIEMALVLVLASIVIATVFGVLLAQWRFHLTRTEVASTHDAARVALEVLTSEFRSICPSLGDLYAIASDSVALRSTTGFGLVCGATGDRFGLRRISGAFGDGRGDSALVFSEGRIDSAADDSWSSIAISAVVAGGAGLCPDGRAPDVTLQVVGALQGVVAGAPVRGFRPYIYRLYRGGDGNWWLGQRLRGGRIQPLAGPFLSPERGGLSLEYRTGDLEPARTPRAVVQVIVSIRARSLNPTSWRAGPRFFVDSLSSIVYVRNS